MKNFFWLILGITLPLVTSAARLENVKILSVKPGHENFEIKLQTNNSPPDSFFYLDIMKTDPDSFEKTMLVVKKMIQKENYRLDLEITSFSASPSGSYYRSEGVLLSGPNDREPNSTKTPKKK